MRPLSIADDIIPLGDFKAQASRLLDELPTRRGPIVITRNGRPAGVVLAPSDYDRLIDRHRYLAEIDEGLHDVESGQTLETPELLDSLGLPGGARRAPRS